MRSGNVGKHRAITGKFDKLQRCFEFSEVYPFQSCFLLSNKNSQNLKVGLGKKRLCNSFLGLVVFSSTLLIVVN